jgi:hypothetical protein
MKRWLTAAIALAVSGAVSAALLIASNPSRDAVGVLAAAQDVPAGTTLSPGSIAVVRINVTVSRALLFSPGDQAALTGLRTTHNLLSGQLIQRSDVTVSPGDRRLVFLPLKDVPAVAPGSHVDLLLITGPTAQPSVQVFATGVEVRDSTSAGLVVVVAADKAAAFVYAGAAMRLAAVVSEAGGSPTAEVPVSSDQEAIALAGAT